jgi:hypothetical protein
MMMVTMPLMMMMMITTTMVMMMMMMMIMLMILMMMMMLQCWSVAVWSRWQCGPVALCSLFFAGGSVVRLQRCRWQCCLVAVFSSFVPDTVCCRLECSAVLSWLQCCPVLPRLQCYPVAVDCRCQCCPVAVFSSVIPVAGCSRLHSVPDIVATSIATGIVYRVADLHLGSSIVAKIVGSELKIGVV